MNVTCAKTKSYKQKTMVNEPIKQTQSKPIYGELVEPFMVSPPALSLSNVPALSGPVVSEVEPVEVSNQQSQFPAHRRRKHTPKRRDCHTPTSGFAIKKKIRLADLCSPAYSSFPVPKPERQSTSMCCVRATASQRLLERYTYTNGAVFYNAAAVNSDHHSSFNPRELAFFLGQRCCSREIDFYNMAFAYRRGHRHIYENT